MSYAFGQRDLPHGVRILDLPATSSAISWPMSARSEVVAEQVYCLHNTEREREGERVRGLERKIDLCVYTRV